MFAPSASPRSVVVFVLAGAWLLSTAYAHAQVRLVPSPDGSLGAWLIAGPLTRPAADNIDITQLDPVRGRPAGNRNRSATWRLVSHADGALDVRRELHVGRDAGPLALLGAHLELAEPLDGWLLVSADGGVWVYADGQLVFSRDEPRLRDRSWDPVPLQLGAGTHRLVVRLRHRGRHWAAAVRVLDRRDLLPPRGMSLVLPGTDQKDSTALVASLRSVEVQAGLEERAYRPVCQIEYRRGAPRGVPLTSRITAQAAGAKPPLLQVDAGAVPIGPRAVHPLRVLLPPIPPDSWKPAKHPRKVEFRVETAGAVHRESLLLTGHAPALKMRARVELDAIAGGELDHVSDPDVAASTLEWHVERLERALDVPGGDWARLTEAQTDLEALLALLEGGADPVDQPGVIDLALRSELDGRPAQVRVHVPASYRKPTDRRYPLVVLLHGYNGSPEGITSAFLGTPSRRPHPQVDGFLIAPHAHGNSFYRGPGEHAVLAALDFALRAYPVDPSRVSITGVSMGGTGTAHIALRYAERFAAAAPLCGYQSFFIRRDTQGRPLRPWEQDRMHHWSPASVAASGRNLPMYIAHGTRDHPLENSRVLVRAYRQLGYSMHDEWPDTGHSVWKTTYAGARMWPWLTQHRRPQTPAHVTVRTDALRYGKLDWVRIVALERPGGLGEVDARVSAPDRLEAKTTAVEQIEFRRTALLQGSAAVLIDGQRLAFSSSEPLVTIKRGGQWAKAGTPRSQPGQKHAGMEGPIRDALLGPVLFVHGSLDPATWRAEREVAESLARLRYGVDVQYPVLADRDVTPALEQAHALVLVGGPDSNGIVRRLAGRLPIQRQSDCITLGDRSFCGPEVGTVFVYPNPDHPDRYVVVVEGVGVAGIWRALSLPQLLPDFLVFDATLASAAGEQVLGGAGVLAGGFFENDWSLPSSTTAGADSPPRP